MRTLFISLLIGLLTFGLVVNEASAKRFGGGRSFGVQRSYNSLFSSKPKQNAIGQNTNKNRWGGILGGLLAGSLLASLFMNHGAGAGMLLIMLGVLGLLYFFFRQRMTPGYQSNTSSRSSTSYDWQRNYNNNNYQNRGGSTAYPTNSISDEVLRDFKVKFIRLQAAYDQKNLQDIQEFTTPEVFAEIKMQLDERGNEVNRTEVINLNVELLDTSEQTGSTLVSVRFTGSIKEEDSINTLDEIWHFQKSNRDNNWVVAGLQQEVPEPV